MARVIRLPMSKLADIYKELRDAVESDYYEKLVQKYLLDNTHVAVVVVAPEKGLTAKLEAETAKKLADFKAGLSEEQVKELVEKTANCRNSRRHRPHRKSWRKS